MAPSRIGVAQDPHVSVAEVGKDTADAHLPVGTVVLADGASLVNASIASVPLPFLSNTKPSIASVATPHNNVTGFCLTSLPSIQTLKGPLPPVTVHLMFTNVTWTHFLWDKPAATPSRDNVNPNRFGLM